MRSFLDQRIREGDQIQLLLQIATLLQASYEKRFRADGGYRIVAVLPSHITLEQSFAEALIARMSNLMSGEPDE
jgi:hypothetical protein